MRTRAESKKIGLPNFLIVGAVKSGTTSLNIFHEDMLKLQTLIGRDLNHWLNE